MGRPSAAASAAAAQQELAQLARRASWAEGEVVDKNLRPHSLQGFMEDVSMGALREDERGLLTAGQSDDEVWEAAAVAARAAVAHGMPSPAGRI